MTLVLVVCLCWLFCFVGFVFERVLFCLVV